MYIRLRSLTLSLVVATLVGPVAAQEAVEESEPLAEEESAPLTAETVLASVNGEEITLGHVIAARATLPAQYDSAPDEQLYNGILQQLIQQEALSQALDTLPPLVALTLENEERSLKAAEVIENLLQNAVSEEDIQAAYDARFANFETSEEYNASHILVETEEEAIALKEELDGGASFAGTAREKSTGPSGPNGGELGWFGTGMMVPSFEAATIALEVGQISDPVETQFGWHVIQLNDVRISEPPALETVREEIVGTLRNTAAVEIISSAADDADVIVPRIEILDFSIVSQRELLEP